MNTATSPEADGPLSQKVIPWLKRAAETLDGYGPGAWIAATIAAFILFAPLGVGFLIYLYWSGRMGRWGCRGRGRKSLNTSGNTAFDAYRDETLKRLEEEREAFESYLERLRAAKDKAEFDQFMAERRGAPQPPQSYQG